MTTFLLLSLKVPVFDARGVEHSGGIDFENIGRSFPQFQGEVPAGSCVAVGHSISTYPGKTGDYEKYGASFHLSTNVLFVIVFGTSAPVS